MPCTPGERRGDRSWQFIGTWRTICCKQRFHTTPVRACMAPQSQTRTSQLGCVCRKYTKLGGPVVPCTPGVHLRDPSRQFIGPWRTICCKRHFRTPPVWICMAPRSRTRTSHLISLCTSCTKLGGPVAPCTKGVRPPDRSRMFTRRWRTICSERNIRTPAVRICTAPRSRTPTTQLGCVCTNYTKV